MKKDSIKTLVIVILVLVIVIGGSFLLSIVGVNSVNNLNTTNYSQEIADEEISEEEQAELTMISIDQYLTLKAGSEKSIIYIARPTCGFCQRQEPIMKNLVYLYQLPVNYLNTDALDEEGFEKLESSDEHFASQWGTPTILIVQNDEVVDIASGYHSKDELIEFFQTNGLLNI